MTPSLPEAFRGGGFARNEQFQPVVVISALLARIDGASPIASSLHEWNRRELRANQRLHMPPNDRVGFDLDVRLHEQPSVPGEPSQFTGSCVSFRS